MADKPERYRKVPREVEAMLIVDYISMKKALKWVEASGGTAHIVDMDKFHEEKLIVGTTLGLVEIPRQYFLIKGDLGGFYSYPATIFGLEYEKFEVEA